MRCVYVGLFGEYVYSQPQIDPNSLFCYIPNKGAPIAFSILYGISAVTHWYQCWYVHALSTYISLVPALSGPTLCALPVSTSDEALGSPLPYRRYKAKYTIPLGVGSTFTTGRQFPFLSTFCEIKSVIQLGSLSKSGLPEIPITLEHGSPAPFFSSLPHPSTPRPTTLSSPKPFTMCLAMHQ